MLKKSLLPALLMTLLLLQGCSSDEADDANSLIATNEFVLTSLDEKQYVVNKKASDFVLENAQGKVILFDIFATWCPPCRAAAKHLSSLQTKYKNDLIVIGLSIEDDITNAKLQEFRNSYDADYILVNSPQNRLLANKIVQELALGERYPIPIIALYKDGKLIKHYIGAIQEEFIESDIKKALGK